MAIRGAIGLGIIGICLALLGFFCTGDLFYACCRNKYNIKLLIKTIDKGNRPGTGVSSVKFFPRTEIVELVRTASSDVDHGVVYVDIPARNENLGVAFGQALNFAFEERISFTNQLIRKLGSTRTLEAFKRGAKVYKAKRGKPAVIVYDNVSQMVPENQKILDTLQDDAKKNADDQIYIAVFVSSEGAKSVTEIHKITEKAEELYQLVGGRILELKDVANDFSSGQSIEDIKEKKSLDAYNQLDSAKLLEDQKHHEVGKRVINALLGSKEISIREFKKLFANEEEYGEVLEANVFAYHPSRNTVSFQSQSIECYIRKNYDVFADLVNLTPYNELSSNYASASKS
ncbi:5073_t:CDS:2 [Diversispora eburnea]|uniref:5073_t:CDS:1 n=1 Tax=Diversispora eburnea TaxID=1213867 RepID=A0A9N9C7Y0_9GLOM|nr:5073_t:CDS:2 [Diversispora eburnea]